MTTGHVQTTHSSRYSVRGGKEHESLRTSKEGSKVSGVVESRLPLMLVRVCMWLDHTVINHVNPQDCGSL